MKIDLCAMLHKEHIAKMLVSITLAFTTGFLIHSWIDGLRLSDYERYDQPIAISNAGDVDPTALGYATSSEIEIVENPSIIYSADAQMQGSMKLRIKNPIAWQLIGKKTDANVILTIESVKIVSSTTVNDLTTYPVARLEGSDVLVSSNTGTDEKGCLIKITYNLTLSEPQLEYSFPLTFDLVDLE